MTLALLALWLLGAAALLYWVLRRREPGIPWWRWTIAGVVIFAWPAVVVVAFIAALWLCIGDDIYAPEEF